MSEPIKVCLTESQLQQKICEWFRKNQDLISGEEYFKLKGMFASFADHLFTNGNGDRLS